MLNSQIIEQIKNAITIELEKNGFCPVEINNFYQGNTLFLRIIVDRGDGGITLDECAHLNNDIGRILDEKNLIQGKYILEVSSPGLDRPLKTKNDFSRCINRRVKFFLSEAINGKIEIDGIIKEPRGEGVSIDTENGIILIPFSKINKAKQII